MNVRRFVLLRHFSTSTTIKPKICVVGSGPAGFYAAQYIANRLETAQIDIFERLPVPFGLVRFGVAPDHANLKKCINSFTKTAQLKNVSYFGNVSVGKDVSIKQLKNAYHVVLLAYGVDDSRKFSIKGSELGNIFQAKDFVGWYNGVPWNKDLNVDLSGSAATVFGHGNVAIDVARLLLSPVDKLRTTDITEHALAALARSTIKEVHLIGRRGPLQVSFTTKELRELLNMPNCCTIWQPEIMHSLEGIVPQLVKPRKRLTELMLDKFRNRQTPTSDQKLLKMVFQRSPKEFLGSERVEGVKLSVNDLEGDHLLEKVAVETREEDNIDTSLVVSSIGYKSVRADEDIPFDEQRGVVKNKLGKVDDGLYAAGWLAKGPSGVLLHTMEHAFGVASVILKDLEVGVKEQKPGFQEIGNILKNKNVQVVTWKDWTKIDEHEKTSGEKLNKPREKVVDIEEMLRLAAL